jgi:hypothetical protein
MYRIVRIVGNKYASHINFNKTVSKSYIVRNTYCIKNNPKNISEHKIGSVSSNKIIKQNLEEDIKPEINLRMVGGVVGLIAGAFISGYNEDLCGGAAYFIMPVAFAYFDYTCILVTIYGVLSGIEYIGKCCSKLLKKK